jgi:dihydrofolate reductase
MRKVIVSMNVTLDGFMSGPNCELDWHFQSWTEEMAESTAELLGDADTILFGRVTYKAMASYWSSKTTTLTTSREDIDFAMMMNSYTKIVFSKTLVKPEWNNSRIMRGDIAASIIELKKLPGRNMIIYGSGRMVDSLIQLGLVDEYQLWVHPVIIGKGKPLFNNLHSTINLELYKAKRFSSGVMLLCYKYQH